MKDYTDDELIKATIFCSIALPILTLPGNGKKPECHSCKHARNFPATHHILCANPSTQVRGNIHGINSGWFMYPLCFDPIWHNNGCDHYEKEIK